MSIRILMVDDEPMILQGIKRWLRSQQPQWRADIAASGQEALDLLTKHHYDVVVSDMRMPGMDGAELLQKVKTKYPHISRIVLSGYCDQEMAIRAVTCAHQYLSKPCDAETFSHAVQRTTALREVLGSDALKTLIARIGSLPSPPDVYHNLLEQMQCPDLSAKDISRTLAKDPAVTAKILQLVNSSFFGLGRHVEAVEQAVPLLGIGLLKTLVLSANLFSQDGRLPAAVKSVSGHCQRVGCIAQKIAKDAGLDNHGVLASFTAGTLHDVGKLILALDDPTKYTKILRQAADRHEDVNTIELNVYGASHAEVGAYLLSLWNLPNPIVEAVAYHHNPSACVNKSFSPLTAVHMANTVDSLDTGAGDGTSLILIDPEYVRCADPQGKTAHWINAAPPARPEKKSA